MARKSKRMALYEAIRQGQAKIAQGLETGQMRSDGTSVPEKAPRKILDKKALLKNLDRFPGISALSKMLAMAIGVAVLVLLLFVIWLVIRPEPQQPAPVDTTTETPSPQQTMQQAAIDEPAKPVKEEGSGFFGFGAKKSEPPADPKEPKAEPAQPSAKPGQNVIVIQQLAQEGGEKLESVQKYYQDNGVATEMIQRSGYVLLVTRLGFDYNPSNEGTEGHRLMQRIRQLGLLYPEQTGDTKFGLRPFQDAYALKK